MSGFNLPITIESRKIVYLDLQQNELIDIDDEYVVETQEISMRSILSISLDKKLQSFNEDTDDILLNDFKYIVSIDEKKAISIKFSKNIQNNINLDRYELDKGFFIESKISTTELRINIQGNNEKNEPINIILEYSNENLVSYTKKIKIHVSDNDSIIFAGLDFGSEASQMKYGWYESDSIKIDSVDLFGSIKRINLKDLKDKELQNDAFEQFESDKLFKSIFYSKKSFTITNNETPFKGALTLLTKNQQITPEFLKPNFRIPNLKIIHNTNFSQSIKFQISNPDGQEFTRSLSSEHQNVYSELLEEMIFSFLKNHVKKPKYLRFTILVPNIYSLEEIKNTKNLIRKIINRYSLNNLKKQLILGLEVISISESDASFMGCRDILPVNNGDSYYICIDCGKGTTDFSVIKSQNKNMVEYIPVYKNGFAGAGNLISFSILNSILHFLFNDFGLNVTEQKKLSKLLNNSFKVDENLTRELYIIIERLKKNYNPNLTNTDVDDHWKNTKNGDIALMDLFTSTSDIASIDFLAVINKMAYVRDWGGYISNCIEEISNEIKNNISPVIDSISKQKKVNFSSIILTGRGFQFKPLENKIKSTITDIQALKNVNFIDSNIDPKEVCLQGIFMRNIKLYNDISNTPIEIKNGTFNRISKVDVIKRDGVKYFLYLLKRFISMDWIFATFPDSEFYDDEANNLTVIEDQLFQCRFLIGSKMYEPDMANLLFTVNNIKNASVVCSRDGYFIRAYDQDDRRLVVRLIPSIAIRFSLDTETRIKKSLFPSYIDNQLLNIN